MLEGFYITDLNGRKMTAEQAAYETFAELYPIESYDLDKEKFCKLMRDKGYNLTDKEIETLINESR